MNYYVKTIVCRASNPKGQALVDYGLICSLLAVFCIGALSAMGVDTISLLTSIAEKLAGLAA